MWNPQQQQWDPAQQAQWAAQQQQWASQGYGQWDPAQQAQWAAQQQQWAAYYQQMQATGQYAGYPDVSARSYQGYFTKATKDKKKDKKDKKKDKKSMSKDEKKKLKDQKKHKAKSNKIQVANYCRPTTYNNPQFVNKIKQSEEAAKQGKIGFGAKTAAEEWAAAGKQEGLQIWRIENFCVVAWPPEFYGKFYDGDSYVVLRTYKRGNALRWDIHFWLGSKSSQDECGTAAYKTVELDGQLGGLAVQHREVQDFESELFLSYFQPALQILHGGVESGFNQVKPEEYRTRLLHLKGRRNVRVAEVSADSDSLNSGDVFILDAGLVLYQWNGKQASPKEKSKADEICRATRNQRKGAPQVIVVDEGREDARFWQLLGGQGPIASAAEGGDDMEAEKDLLKSKVLMQLSDQSGQLRVTEVARGRINRAMLKSNDVFIFDTGYEVHAWIGKGASPQEKKNALSYAQDYLVQYNRPQYLPISRVMEGCESEALLASFDP